MSSFSFPLSAPFGSGFSFVPAPGPGGTPLSMLDATPAGGLAGQLDQLIDPTTGDYVLTDNGEFAETADSRTSMLLMQSIEYGGSPFDSSDGTTIRARMRDGDPVTPEDIRAETLRAGEVLRQSGILSDLEVFVRDQDGSVLRDQSGRLVVRVNWRDLASGSPTDIALQPG